MEEKWGEALDGVETVTSSMPVAVGNALTPDIEYDSPTKNTPGNGKGPSKGR